MNAMPQSAKALKLVGDVHANTSSGKEKVKTVSFYYASMDFANIHYMNVLPKFQILKSIVYTKTEKVFRACEHLSYDG